MTAELYLWIAVFVALIITAPLLKKLFSTQSNAHRYAHTGLAEVRRMDWREFEHYLGYLFRALGYQATVTQASGDFGVDVLVTAPDGTKIAVQAKHWRSEYVGVEHVLKTVGGAAHYGCQRAIVVTTSGITDAAREASRTTGVELWGPKELAEAIDRARARTGALPAAKAAGAPVGLPIPRKQAMPRVATPVGLPVPKQTALPRVPAPTGLPLPRQTAQVQTTKPIAQSAPPSPQAPRCPKCGKPMTPKIALERPIWLCSRFPECNGFIMQ